MSRLSHILLSLGLIALGCPILPTAAAQPVKGGPAQAGLVVLQNGNVVRGNIWRLDDHYRVELPGGELRIRAEQVEMFCTDLDDAYRQRRASRTSTSADSHLELARWCMRYDLHDQAARELEDARTIDSEHRRLSLLDRQLHQLVKLSSRSKQPPAAVPPSAEELAEQQKNDQQALDKAPKWARVLFVRQVQPLLVHSCATAGCHQPGSSIEKFQIDRLAIDAAGHPSVTQRNLAATLTQIDWDSPDQSQLLQQALTAHGDSDARHLEPLAPHKVKLLKMWVEQMATANQASAASELLAAKPASNRPRGTAAPIAKATSQAIQLAGHVERDPFDASFFNSRYGGEQVASHPVQATTTAAPMNPQGSLTPPFAATPEVPE